MPGPLRVALVHDWLTGMRGGEYVLEAIAELFPRADLFTLLYVPSTVSPTLTTLKRHTSWLKRVPAIEKRYRGFLPLMPSIIESFDLTEFDLIISSSHCVAKGVRKRPDAVHVSYVHAPMRYIWDRYDEYFGKGRASYITRLAAQTLRPRLQAWDRRVSQPDRVDCLIANSRYIADEIKSVYGREAKVVHPFADLSRFQAPRKPSRNYLMVGAFAPYKRVDLAVETFNRLKLPLVVVGSGQDEERVKKRAGPTIDFLGHLSNAAIADLYSKSKALVFPGKEDFGITPLESMGAGTPVIAYAAGGALETVTEKSGVFFREQTVESFSEAVMKIESGEAKLSEEDCRAQAAKFSRERFQREFVSVVRSEWTRAGNARETLDERIRTSWSALAETL
jgi:glycosyltransferase involved in cell wall biosynthesis